MGLRMHTAGALLGFPNNGDGAKVGGHRGQPRAARLGRGDPAFKVVSTHRRSRPGSAEDICRSSSFRGNLALIRGLS